MFIYPKTYQLFERDNNTKKLIFGKYLYASYENIKKWHVEEKIDGTNIRLSLFPDGTYQMGGRSDNSNIPSGIVNFIMQHFSWARILNFFATKDNCAEVILFMEGFGAKIQNGGELYRDDASLCLFDVRINDFWLSRDAVKSIANQLELITPPSYGLMTIDEIVELVSSEPHSTLAQKDRVIEGIIARTDPILLKNNGERLMFKLGCEDMKRMKK